MPITVYEKHFDLCDVRTMSRGDIIAIITYLYNLETAGLKECVVENFINILCNEKYKMLPSLTDSGIPKMTYIFDKYIAVFISCVENCGVFLTLTYDKNAMDEEENDNEEPKPPFDSELDCNGLPKPKIREPFYTSPYERFFWYDKYAWPGHFFWSYPKRFFDEDDIVITDNDKNNKIKCGCRYPCMIELDDIINSGEQEEDDNNPLNGVCYNYFISESMLFDDMDICLV